MFRQVKFNYFNISTLFLYLTKKLKMGNLSDGVDEFYNVASSAVS
jgi:hypothetical protein